MTYQQFLLAAVFAFALIGCIAGDNERKTGDSSVVSSVEANNKNSERTLDIPPLP
tara:strand:+ start:294 stop:458 length:165 start_codon:yes stop_codon:yes gene_type:complete